MRRVADLFFLNPNGVCLHDRASRPRAQQCFRQLTKIIPSICRATCGRAAGTGFLWSPVNSQTRDLLIISGIRCCQDGLHAETLSVLGHFCTRNCVSPAHRKRGQSREAAHYQRPTPPDTLPFLARRQVCSSCPAKSARDE